MTIYKSICDVTVGQFVEPLILDSAKNEIVDQHLASKKARAQIGWTSEYTLDEGLRLTANWYKKYFEEIK